MNKKAIGIIGGMGPDASQYFYKLLICRAQRDYHVGKNEDFPEIYLASIPVPDFITSEERKEEALLMLLDRLNRMDSLPVSFFCLACNTGHLLLEDLRRETNKPFISLLEVVPRFLKRKQINKIGLLATPTTIQTKMYEKPLEKKGIELILPSSGDIKILGDIILNTVAGKNFDNNQFLIQRIARRLLDSGAQGILEACTEIPQIFPKQHLIPVFDTLEILADAVLKRYYLLK